MPPVRHDMNPGGVVAGQGDGHGWYGVLHYGQQLDVAQMEVVLIAKPELENVLAAFYRRNCQ